MTCTVGLVSNRRVVMGADSAGVDDSFSLAVRADRKVFRVGEMIFGFAGSFRMANLLQHKLVVPQRPKGVDTFRWMTTEFIDAVRHCFLEGGIMQKEDNLESVDGHFICGFAGQLYVIYEDFQVGENLDGYVAIGVGGPIAEGSLFSTKKLKTKLTAEERVLLALEASEEHSGGVRGPFQVISTDEE